MLLFVLCEDNSILSPMAESYLKFYLKDKFEINSAGISPTAIHPMAINSMKEDGFDLSKSQAKSYKDFKKSKFDVLLTIGNLPYKAIPNEIRYNKHYHIELPPPSQTANWPATTLKDISRIRETLKKELLLFVGKLS